MHCGRFLSPMTRREALQRCAGGFGAVAMAGLLGEKARAEAGPLSPRVPHLRARARNIIFLYMDGGPSQVDTFDYKPLLEKYHGEDPRKAMGKLEPTQFANVGKVMKSPWAFHRYGECGHWVSDLFPHVAKHADKLAVIKSCTSEFSEHTSANRFLHTGTGIQGRPSMGAWIGYGLGSVNSNLPGFVVLNGGLIPPGGLANFDSGFLPASFQGSVFKPSGQPVANIESPDAPDVQQNKLRALASLDRLAQPAFGGEEAIESAILNYETAFQMQSAVPELMDLSGESDLTKKMYGLEADWNGTKIFGRQCLIARRLVERGVRFIELTCPGGNGDRWDQHTGLLDGHTKNCLTVDQPIAALLADLEGRGLLDDTLVVWTGEFGRTPFAQGADGRDHNPFGYSFWMAGGGVKGGVSYGETDEWGYKAIQDRIEIHDLHATMLHLLGVEHTRSTYRFSGRDMRLTDVHGHVLRELIDA